MSEFYPENLLPVIREESSTSYTRFAELREQVLLDYGYSTARAYWGDLDDVFRWASERGKDVLALSEEDIRQYIALLRRRQYSESTVRRRVTSLRHLYKAAIKLEFRTDNPTAVIRIGRRRTQRAQ